MDDKKEDELVWSAPAATPIADIPPHAVERGYKGELFNETFTVGHILEAFINKLRQNRMIDPRWVAIAKTHFQEGISATRRAVMNNDRF